MSEPQFLNVDLVIYSRTPLTDLAAEFGKRALILHCGSFTGGYLLAVEINRQFKTPDATARALCALVEGLSAKGKRAWRLAYRREFDVGYDLASDGYISRAALKSETLARMAVLEGTLIVTFYNPDKMGSAKKVRREPKRRFKS